MTTFVLAAFKGNQLLKQWVLQSNQSKETLALSNWITAKALGADRICVAESGGKIFACWNGSKLVPAQLSLPVPPPPEPKCPPGLVFDANGKCVPMQTLVPGRFPSYTQTQISLWGNSLAKQQQQCPPGSHYDTLEKRCVPNFSIQRQALSGSIKWLGDTPSSTPGIPSITIIYKTLLLKWSKSPEAQSMVPKLPFDDYGNPSLDNDPTTWKCSRDGRMLTAFSVWWNNAKKTPQLSVGVIPASGPCEGLQTTELDQPHMDALQAWSTGGWPVQQQCPPGTKLVNGVCVLDVGPIIYTTTSPGQPQPPGHTQPGQPQTQPSANRPQTPGSETPTAPTAPTKTSKSTSGWLIVGAIGVAVVGGIALLAGKSKAA